MKHRLPLLANLLCLTATAAESRALWVDSWSPGLFDAAQISQLVSAARAGHFNAVIVEVRRRGDAFYNSNFEPRNAGLSPDFDPLADLLAKAHNTNDGPRLSVHCWIVTYPVWTADSSPPQPDHPLNLHPEWRNQTYHGSLADGHAYYFDPGHPEVQRHTFKVAMDIITRYDVDGLNWDYIRYPGSQWGYNPVSVARFNSKHNRTGLPAMSDPLWAQFRRDQVTALVRKVYLSAIAIKPQVVLSADTFASVATSEAGWRDSSAYKTVFQDWRSWMEEGVLDLNIPMTYFAQATASGDFANSIAFTKNHRYSRHAAIGPALYKNSISNSLVQIRSTRTVTPEGNRADGVSCYSYAANNNEGRPLSDLLNALTQPSTDDPILPPVFEQVDVPPDMPWKSAPTKGHLKGFVQDEGTNGLDGATIILSGPVTNTLLSDATGFYGAVDLLPGTYALASSFPAYAAVTQTVSVVAGAVAAHDFSLTPTGVTMVLQPQDCTVLLGSNVTLTATAAGLKPLSYQWLLNGASVAEATNASLVLSNVHATNAGAYQLVVANSSGAVTSLVANLIVQFALQTSVIGSGSVSINPPRTGYAPGSTVVLAANPAAGFMFSHWSGDLFNSNNPVQIAVTNSLSITAHFVPSPYDLILDNPNASYAGSWGLGNTAAGRYGDDYRYVAMTSGAPTARATYRPSLTVSGNYDVFLWYPQGSNRATNAPWVICYSGGLVTSSVNQTTGGGTWLHIGTKWFEAGTNSFVQLMNGGGVANQYAIADAVRFAWSKTQPLSGLRTEPGGWVEPGSFALSLRGNASQVWLIEATTNFAFWLPLETVRVSHPLDHWIDQDGRLYQRRFYRARQAKAFGLADFETNAVGSAVLFQAPTYSGTTSAFIDQASPNMTVVTNVFPPGNVGSKVLLASWTFLAGTNADRLWLRLTTHMSPVRPNPTVGFQQVIGFAAHADRDVYLAAGLRETDSGAAIGADGGTTGNIEWIGGIMDNNSDPPKGRFIPAGQWVWIELTIPGEPVRGFTGNGVLESATGKGVFEELAIVPGDGPGPYKLYLDQFQFIDLSPW